MIGALVFVCLTSAIGFALYRPQRTTPVASAAEPTKNIHVEVLNGCGKDGIAQQVGQHLRSLGFDVMTWTNAGSFNYPESMVIDRVGNPGYARQVAEALGIQNQIQQIIADPFRIEQVTVIIGRDYPRLNLPQER